MVESSKAPAGKVTLVFQGLQDIVGVVGLLVGIVTAFFSWTGNGRSADMLVLALLIIAFFISVVVFSVYLRYEKLGNGLEGVGGDLTELYSQMRDKHNRVTADIWLLVQVLRLAPAGMKWLFRT